MSIRRELRGQSLVGTVPTTSMRRPGGLSPKGTVPTSYLAFAWTTLVASASLSLHTTADASDSTTWSPYVVVSGQADDADSSQALLELGSSIGAVGWMRGGVGRATLADTEDRIETKLFKLAGGASIAAVDIEAGLAHRADGDAFKQQDWAFALSWQYGSGSIGADVFIRSADSETVTSVRRRRLDPREVRVVESIDGAGYGLHADFDIAASLTAFASWMQYDYDIETNRPLLSRFSLLNGSGITRSEAFLDRSFIAGLTWRFMRVSLTGMYMHDEALVEDDVTDTAQISALFMIGDHWSVTPMLGVSENDLHGDTAFGGLALGYAW